MLDGLTVLEMGHVVAAPSAGLLLADMGADVIKVERLPGGDFVRTNPPMVDGESAYFAMLNRNKRGVALNLGGEGGRGVLKRLMMGADVFIENLRAGAMAHYGLAYDQVKADCPRLVYCAISGFGQTGPYAQRGGFDLVAQGMSGLMSLTGEGPGRPPVKVGVPVTDITAGALATVGILGALIRRSLTGKGQLVDTSLFEAGIMLTYLQSAIHLASGEVPGAMGSAHPVMAPYQAFKTADGWIIIGAGNQRNWLKLVDCLETPDLARDPRFAESADRMANLDDLVATLDQILSQRPGAEWLERLEGAGIPSGPVLDVAAMAADPQTRARSMIQEVKAASGAPIRVIGHPVKYSDTPAAIRRGAPGLSEHTAQVLREFGFDDGEVADLAEAGDIGSVG